MPRGFAPRFTIEVGFLILLGVGAGYADLRTWVIVALLAGGWIVVSLIELAVWRSQARPAVAYVPPAAQGGEPEREPEPEQDNPRPATEDTEYPLRAGAGTEPSEEVEAYTRVLRGDRADDPPGEDAE
jgi:hypothetical protein